MQNYKMYINGDFCEASDGKTIEVISPVDEHVVGTVPAGTREDAKRALEAAQAAAPEWGKLPPQTRAAYVQKLHDLLLERHEEYAQLLCEEHGKPIGEARGEIDAALAMMKMAIGWAPRIKGDVLYSGQKDELLLIEKVPYGVVVGISAWNYPFCIAARKYAIGLVCGNTMIIKPPSLIPLTCMKFGELIDAAGFPKGVFNMVSGGGSTMGDELVRSPITQLVSLTGSTQAGIEVISAGAANITDMSLELGGKAPFIVLKDADLEKAVDGAMSARFNNCGQVCTCNERMYIEEAVYEEMKEALLSRVKKLKVGASFEEDTDIGPKVSREEVEKIRAMVERAKEQGAEVLYEAELSGPLFEKGFWYPPTVLEVKDNSIDIMHEEVFGPVLILMKVKNIEEAIAFSNDCPYGLSAYLYTRSHKSIMTITRDLQFGEIYVNRSIGEELNAYHHGYKASGTQGDDGEYGMEAFLQTKTIYLNYDYAD